MASLHYLHSPTRGECVHNKCLCALRWSCGETLAWSSRCSTQWECTGSIGVHLVVSNHDPPFNVAGRSTASCVTNRTQWLNICGAMWALHTEVMPASLVSTASASFPPAKTSRTTARLNIFRYSISNICIYSPLCQLFLTPQALFKKKQILS